MVLPTVTFGVNDSTINRGENTTLFWTSIFAYQVRLDGATVALSGDKIISPTVTKTYVLIAQGTGGNIRKEVTVTVIQPPGPEPEPEPEPEPPTPEPPPPGESEDPTVTFQAFPDTIFRGKSTDLVWTSIFAYGVVLDGETVNLSGSKTVSPAVTTTYQLRAVGYSGSITKYVTVTVKEPVQICTPKTTKCMNGNLYKCSDDGLDWTLEEINSPVCKKAGECPSFLSDPIGAVLCWMLNGLQALWGYTVGTVSIVIDWVYELQAIITVEVIKLLQNPIDYIKGIIGNAVADIVGWFGDQWDSMASFWGGITDHIGSWWGGVIDTVKGWIGEAIIAVYAFIGGAIDNVMGAVGVAIDVAEVVWGNSLGLLHGQITDETNKKTEELWTEAKRIDEDAQTGLDQVTDALIEHIGNWFADFMGDAMGGMENEFDIMALETESPPIGPLTEEGEFIA